jgi:Predicted ATPase
LQLAELAVYGLFGRYDHVVQFPMSTEDNDVPSVVILFGPNGIGKTTLLQMLDGFMRLDFDAFRRVPFGRAHLKFSNGKILYVKRLDDGTLRVSFGNHSVVLSGERKGAADESDADAVKSFRKAFFNEITGLTLEYLDESRLIYRRIAEVRAMVEKGRDVSGPAREGMLFLDSAIRLGHYGGPRVRANLAHDLAARVERFVIESQVDYKAFFSTDEPDLFPKIIDNLTSPPAELEAPEAIEKRLQRVRDLEDVHRRFGLDVDRWDFDQLVNLVHRLGGQANAHASIVLSTYTEFLESRAEARQLVAERLVVFEEIMREFFFDKRVRISRKGGLRIESSDGELLGEEQLSSGEYQLLYLMVAALTTKRRGSVIAIDEPELSMHPAWARKLVRNLLRCASRATPQLILATHSPEIATDYPDRLVELSPPRHES